MKAVQLIGPECNIKLPTTLNKKFEIHLLGQGRSKERGKAPKKETKGRQGFKRVKKKEKDGRCVVHQTSSSEKGQSELSYTL